MHYSKPEKKKKDLFHRACKMTLRLGQAVSERCLQGKESALSYQSEDSSYRLGKLNIKLLKQIQNCCCKTRANSIWEQWNRDRRKLQEDR
jgi:hypothetical protein